MVRDGLQPVDHERSLLSSTRAIESLQKDRASYRILGAGSTLLPNTAQIYGIDDVRGFDYVTVRRYEELITGKAGDFFFYDYAPDIPAAFRLLNAKYLLLPGPRPLDPNQFDLVYEDEIAIYRFKHWLERALPVFDYEVHAHPNDILTRVRADNFDPRKVLLLEEAPREGPQPAPHTAVAQDAVVQIKEYEPDEILIQASLPRCGFLLLLDTYFPGWEAEVNDRAARIYRADYNFRAVALPPGNRRCGSRTSPRASGSVWAFPRQP